MKPVFCFMSEAVPHDPGKNGATGLASAARLWYASRMQKPDDALPNPLVSTSADWLGGRPAFATRRVPLEVLFGYLKSDRTLQDFLDDYPSVSRTHAIAVIECARAAIEPPAIDD